MSILAEPRRKRKICADPQNMTWKNDTNKFGHKMLEKMGWSDGQGLGLNNQGMTENIKLNANYTQKGIGAETNDADRTWISHHDEFSFLLEKLNAKKAAKIQDIKKECVESSDSEDEKAPSSKKMCEDNSKSLEVRSKTTKTRIHYKFTKMKDLARYSEKDKSAVIGVGLKSKSKETKEKTSEKTKEESATVKSSGVSLNDYFAAKMAKFYSKKDSPTVEINEEIKITEDTVPFIEESGDEKERQRLKAEKKALKKAKRNAEVLSEATAEIHEADEEERRRKAERKDRKRKEKEARVEAEEK